MKPPKQQTFEKQAGLWMFSRKECTEMRTILRAVAAGCLLLTSAFADTWDKKTILTVNEPLLVPGATLEPGKYVVKLVNSQANRYIVQVLNEREDQVITTILAIPNWRLKLTGDTQFMFWETPAGNPPALRAWFYPGDNFGQEFAYPKGLAAKIAEKVAEPVPAYTAEPATEKELAAVPVTTVEKPREAPVLVAKAPRPVPTPPAEPEPAVTPPPGPAEMPKTGSFAPSLLVGGLAALSAGIALRYSVRRH
jgi:hypothetical protein